LPQVLSRVASNLPDGPARAAVNANLSDELGRPAPHLDLFDTFAAAAGARCGAPPAPATRSLTALQLSSAASDPVRGLGVLAAYETQLRVRWGVGLDYSPAHHLTGHVGLPGTKCS
jgi:hypothetical protein